MTRVTQLRFLRSHPELLEGLLDVINTPHGQIRQFNSAVLVRLWCAMVRSTCARGVRAALAGNESDSALRRAQFAQHGEERFCLPNRDQLECNAHVVNWAGAYAQLLDHTHVPASPAYKEVGNDGAVVRASSGRTLQSGQRATESEAPTSYTSARVCQSGLSFNLRRETLTKRRSHQNRTHGWCARSWGAWADCVSCLQSGRLEIFWGQ